MFKYLPHLIAGLMDQAGRHSTVTLSDLHQIALHLAKAEREEKCQKDKEVEKTPQAAREPSSSTVST